MRRKENSERWRRVSSWKMLTFLWRLIWEACTGFMKGWIVLRVVFITWTSCCVTTEMKNTWFPYFHDFLARMLKPLVHLLWCTPVPLTFVSLLFELFPPSLKIYSAATRSGTVLSDEARRATSGKPQEFTGLPRQFGGGGTRRRLGFFTSRVDALQSFLTRSRAAV